MTQFGRDASRILRPPYQTRPPANRCRRAGAARTPPPQSSTYPRTIRATNLDRARRPQSSTFSLTYKRTTTPRRHPHRRNARNPRKIRARRAFTDRQPPEDGPMKAANPPTFSPSVPILDRQHPAPRRPTYRRRPTPNRAPPPHPHPMRPKSRGFPPRPDPVPIQSLSHTDCPFWLPRSSLLVSPGGYGPKSLPLALLAFSKNNFSQNSPLTVSPSRWYHSRHRSDGRSTRGCHGPVGAVRFRGPADAK